MIVKCNKCLQEFDDQFRYTLCDHWFIRTNDGHNNFKYNTNSVGPNPVYFWLASYDIATDKWVAVPVRHVPSLLKALFPLSKETGEELNDLGGLDCGGDWFINGSDRWTGPTTEADIKQRIAVIKGRQP